MKNEKQKPLDTLLEKLNTLLTEEEREALCFLFDITSIGPDKIDLTPQSLTPEDHDPDVLKLALAAAKPPEVKPKKAKPLGRLPFPPPDWLN